MGVGLIPAVANSLLDALCRAVNYTAPTALWVKLHIGDPGVAAATNPAVNTIRKQATFGTPAAGGSVANTVDIAWSAGEVTGSEDYSHYSTWTLVTGGSPQFTGVINANAVVIGDQFKILAGGLVCTFAVAS